VIFLFWMKHRGIPISLFSSVFPSESTELNDWMLGTNYIYKSNKV